MVLLARALLGIVVMLPGIDTIALGMSATHPFVDMTTLVYVTPPNTKLNPAGASNVIHSSVFAGIKLDNPPGRTGAAAVTVKVCGMLLAICEFAFDENKNAKERSNTHFCRIVFICFS